MKKAILLIVLLVILTNCQTVTITNQFVLSCYRIRLWKKNRLYMECNNQSKGRDSDTNNINRHKYLLIIMINFQRKRIVFTHFTGCSEFFNDIDKKCQIISQRCITITDGVYYRACSTYLISKSCVINNVGRYCFWITTDAANSKCEDADDGPKVPVLQTSNLLLYRAQLNKYTAQEGEGCIKFEQL